MVVGGTSRQRFRVILREANLEDPRVPTIAGEDKFRPIWGPGREEVAARVAGMCDLPQVLSRSTHHVDIAGCIRKRYLFAVSGPIGILWIGYPFIGTNDCLSTPSMRSIVTIDELPSPNPKPATSSRPSGDQSIPVMLSARSSDWFEPPGLEAGRKADLDGQQRQPLQSIEAVPFLLHQKLRPLEVRLLRLLMLLLL